MKAEEAGQSVASAAEVVRLEAEKDALRRELKELKGRKRGPAGRFRRWTAGLLVVVSCLLLVLGATGIWAYRTVFNTDKWVERVAPVVEHREVTDALSRRLTEQLFVLIDVEALTVEALPPRAAIIAGPLTSAVEDTVEKGVSDVLASAQFQALWIEANRVAHQQILAILRGDSEVVQATGGEVSLNLLPVMNAVIGRLETSASGLFGKEINVPEISNGEVPAEARQKIEDAVGVDVPEDFGEIPVYQSDALSAAQDALGTLDDVMLAVIIAIPLVVAAAILISGRRRRTIIQLLTGTLLGLVVVRRLVIWSQDQVVDIAREENRGAVRVAVDDLMSSFFSISAGVIIAGLILLAIAVVTGPYGWAVSLRRHARDATVGIWGAVTNASQGEATASWIRAHRDLLKLVGVAFAILVLLLFDLSWAAFLAIVAVVVGYELFVSRVGGSDPAPSVSEKPA